MSDSTGTLAARCSAALCVCVKKYLHIYAAGLREKAENKNRQIPFLSIQYKRVIEGSASNVNKNYFY